MIDFSNKSTLFFQLTYGDIAMFQLLYAFNDPEDPFYRTLPACEERLSMLADYPGLVGLVNRVLDESGIRFWVDTRPKGLF